MGDINKPTITNEQNIDDIRAAFEHRATWLYYLLNEIKESGDWEAAGRRAVRNCGFFHAVEKKILDVKDENDLRLFKEAFINQRILRVFEGEVIESKKDQLKINFHYCPLVTAWEKLGVTQEDIITLCDIAMEGDRAIADKMDYRFTLGKVIAKNDPICELQFDLL